MRAACTPPAAPPPPTHLYLAPEGSLAMRCVQVLYRSGVYCAPPLRSASGSAFRSSTVLKPVMQARQPARHYEHNEAGYNYRLSNVLAGIGRGQLEVLDQRVKARRAVFDRYYEALSGIEGIEFMPEAEYGKSTRWLTALTVDPGVCKATRDQIIDALEEDNIEARPVWKPMHLQPLYKASKYYPHMEEESVSDRLFENGLCLPSGSNLEIGDQERVIDLILECLK